MTMRETRLLNLILCLLSLSSTAFGVHIEESVESFFTKASSRKVPAKLRRRAQGKGGGKGSSSSSSKSSKSAKSARAKKSKKSKNSSRGPSESAGTTGGVLDDDEFGSRFESRLIQIKHGLIDGKCIGYNKTLSGSSLVVMDCTTTGEMDFWEVLELSSSEFYLRHNATQKCMPQNPEYPGESFDCFAPSGESVAIADSMNGLTDCSEAGNPAVIGFTDPVNNLYMYNTMCTTGVAGNATDVMVMSYTNDGGEDLVVWGEKVLLRMPTMVEQHNLNGVWLFQDVL